jgi:hypothetical protein
MEPVYIDELYGNHATEFIERVKNDTPLWFQITDKLSPYYGSIGFIVLKQTNVFKLYVKEGKSTVELIRKVLYDNTNPKFYFSNNKETRITISWNEYGYKNLFLWIPDHQGNPIYKFTKNPADNIRPIYDLLGNEITENSLVVAGSGDGAVQIANVTRIFVEKRRVRADIKVVVSKQILDFSDGKSPYEPSESASVGINNLIVITDEFKSQVTKTVLKRNFG